MEEFKILKKLVNMCKTCVQKTVCAVRIEGTLLNFFEHKTGLKQGDTLSLILFNLALQKNDTNETNCSTGIKIGKEQLNILTCTDDIVLVGKIK
jgi:hypothetical protein